MKEEERENLNIYIDKMGRTFIPKYIRKRLGIAGKEAEINITIKVNQVYEPEEEK